MQIEDVRKFKGRKIKLLLKNRDFQLNGFIEEIKGELVYFKDKYGYIIPVEAEVIGAIVPLENGGGR